MGRQQPAQQVARPKRKATNAHVFRYLQTRNPSRLEENDLKKALEASLEECPADFFWPAEDSASCSSSEQSNSTTTTTSSSTNNSRNAKSIRPTSANKPPQARRSLNNNKSSMQHHHHHHNHQSHTANHKCCPMSCAHNRYKPVAKKNIYSEADFFHEGIMEYIEFALAQSSKFKQQQHQC